MAKPNVLCKLRKGKLVDTFRGFVDTFNYLVDFVENLRGDGDDDKDKHIKVDRSVPDRPVIKFDGELGGGSTIKLLGTDGSEAIVGDPQATEFKTITFGSAADVEVVVAGDGQGNATATIDISGFSSATEGQVPTKKGSAIEWNSVGGSDELEVITGISFSFESGKLKATLTKKKLKGVSFDSVDDSSVDVARVVTKSIVTNTSYNADGTFEFKQEKLQATVMADYSTTTESTVFTTTELT